MKKYLSPFAFVLSITVSHGAFAAGYAYSPQDVLIGADQVAASANYGKGVVFGDIDTGNTPQWVGFSPTYNGEGLNNIDTKDSISCLNSRSSSCDARTTPTDGNSHGTFTASEIVGAVQSVGLQGVDPAGTLFAVQVLNAQGSGNSTDVANGIMYAANHGAMVLNLSLGPAGGTSGVAFYQSLASAINYAASKGTYVVFAGGNSALPFVGNANITGFTDTAIQHMLFMGSTNASKQLSSFSNTAGTGHFTSTTGHIYNYDNMWLMADGENIWGASNYHTFQYGYSYIQQDSGTSMSAPQGTGAIGLLLAKWPILKTNGMAAQILEQAGTDLGAAGIDTTYGDGFLNLVQAFQAAGTLTVSTPSGPVQIGQAKSVVSGGALGAMSHISSALSNYTVFDMYQRNYTMNLSGLVGTKTTTSPVSLSVAAPRVTGSAMHLADGSSLAFGSSDVDTITHPEGSTASNPNWYASFTDAYGSTVAAGNGFPASASFAEALWGNDSPVSSEAYNLGVSNALVSLAEGGQFAAIGNRIGAESRVAFSWSQTQPINAMTNDLLQSNANAMTAGLSTNVTSGWKAGVTLGMLNEQSGMLGSTYAANGPLNLGDNNHSMSMGVSSILALGGRTDLLVDAAIARTEGASLSGGLISGVTPLYARSYGAALVHRDAIGQGDNVSFSVKAPLKVYSGSASLTTNSVDAGGNPILGSQRVSLKPSGNEMDFTASYQAPVRDNLSWNMSLEARHDADNIAGASDIAGLAGLKLTF